MATWWVFQWTAGKRAQALRFLLRRGGLEKTERAQSKKQTPPGRIAASLYTSLPQKRFIINFAVIFLVGGLEHFLFSHLLGIIIPID